MKNILILFFSLLLLGCSKEELPSLEGGESDLKVNISLNDTRLEETVSLNDGKVSKIASIRKIEQLCKCIKVKALIYRGSTFIAEKEFEAGYVGTIFSGLSAYQTYKVIFYSENATTTLPNVMNRTNLSNAYVSLAQNKNLMYTTQDIHLKPGTNTVSISLKHLYPEVKFVVNNNGLNNVTSSKITVLNNFSNSRVAMRNGNVTGHTSNTYNIPIESVSNKIYNFVPFFPNISTTNLNIKVNTVANGQSKNLTTTYSLQKGHKYVKEIKFQ